MFGMQDHQSRVEYAREHAGTLRSLMRASRRERRQEDNAGRPTPARADTATPHAAQIRPHRGAV